MGFSSISNSLFHPSLTPQFITLSPRDGVLQDGFKPGQRKILFACFKRNLTSEIKVGHVSTPHADSTVACDQLNPFLPCAVNIDVSRLPSSRGMSLSTPRTITGKRV